MFLVWVPSTTCRRSTTYPLHLHEAYVRLYPAQVIKQADLVLAMQFQSHAFATTAPPPQPPGREPVHRRAMSGSVRLEDPGHLGTHRLP